MRLIITFQTGFTTEALLLALSRETMRVLVPGQPDAILLSKQNGCWHSESGESVEVDAAMPVAGVNYAAMFADFAPRTMTAGN